MTATAWVDVDQAAVYTDWRATDWWNTYLAGHPTTTASDGWARIGCDDRVKAEHMGRLLLAAGVPVGAVRIGGVR